MKKMYYQTFAVMLAIVFSTHVQARDVKYDDMEGARRISPQNGFWEVGWVPGHYKNTPVNYPVPGLQGVVFKKYNDSTPKNRIVKAADMGIDPNTGIKLPMLGINGDLYISTFRDGECPIRYYGDDGSVVFARWSRGPYFYFYTSEPAKWYKSDCSVKDRHKAMEHKIYEQIPRAVMLDSRWLDTDKDGFWKAKTLLKIRSYKMPMTLKYVMILPATTLDVPMDPSWVKGAVISFEYATLKGTTKASFLMDPAFMPKSGALRIGFVGRNSERGLKQYYAYVVQNPGRGKEGIVIGKVPLYNGRLQIKPGTLKITKAKWIPYDRSPVEKQKIIGKEGCPEDDLEAFDYRKFGGWGYARLDPSTHFAGIATPKVNPYTRVRRDSVARYIKAKLKAGPKYGMRIAVLASTEPTQSIYIPDKYKAEKLDAKTGKFVKATYLDWCNEEAVAWESKNLKRRLSAYKGLPSYALVHESIGRANFQPNLSVHALESFRKFIGDPKALFPAVITTNRTTADADDELKKKYRQWRLGYYRGRKLMLGILKPTFEALKGGRFKGIGYFGGTWENDDGAISYLAEAPEVVFLCAENVRSKDQRDFRSWRETARKYQKRIELLPHSYPMLVNKSTEGFIKWFEDLALLPEIDGVLLGGGGRVPVKLFEALAAKHFGKGRMSEKEADRIIKTLKKKGIFYLEEKNEVK